MEEGIELILKPVLNLNRSSLIMASTYVRFQTEARILLAITL